MTDERAADARPFDVLAIADACVDLVVALGETMPRFGRRNSGSQATSWKWAAPTTSTGPRRVTAAFYPS